ncbi:SUF system Fe-S cluster assembly regulator [Sneathiella sp.]|uniref:SUF system Fe-S cluster assembly regulator n=1 Tax=Sneathiella sp. TaxID=1964365 RepID=UPI0035692BC0
MIKLSKMTDYGVVIMSEMARLPERTMTAPDVSLYTGLPVPTAAKILRVLAKSPFLTSQRGAHGGYQLSRKPADISIAEIIRAIEGPVAVTSCVDESGDDCAVEERCPMRGGWEKINRALNAALEEVTLADMCLDTEKLNSGQRTPNAGVPSPLSLSGVK